MNTSSPFSAYHHHPRHDRHRRPSTLLPLFTEVINLLPSHPRLCHGPSIYRPSDQEEEEEEESDLPRSSPHLISKLPPALSSSSSPVVVASRKKKPPPPPPHEERAPHPTAQGHPGGRKEDPSSSLLAAAVPPFLLCRPEQQKRRKEDPPPPLEISSIQAYPAYVPRRRTHCGGRTNNHLPPQSDQFFQAPPPKHRNAVVDAKKVSAK